MKVDFSMKLANLFGNEVLVNDESKKFLNTIFKNFVYVGDNVFKNYENDKEIFTKRNGSGIRITTEKQLWIDIESSDATCDNISVQENVEDNIVIRKFQIQDTQTFVSIKLYTGVVSVLNKFGIDYDEKAIEQARIYPDYETIMPKFKNNAEAVKYFSLNMGEYELTDRLSHIFNEEDSVQKVKK